MTDHSPSQRLLDERAIGQLAAAYSHAVSCLDASAAAAFFTDDASLKIMSKHVETRTAIEAGMRETFAQFEMLQLLAHGSLIEVRGDSGHALWSTTEFTIRKGSKALNAIFGRYEDGLVRTQDGWRFSRRAFSRIGRVQLDVAKSQTDSEFLRNPMSAFSQIGSLR